MHSRHMTKSDSSCLNPALLRHGGSGRRKRAQLRTVRCTETKHLVRIRKQECAKLAKRKGNLCASKESMETVLEVKSKKVQDERTTPCAEAILRCYAARSMLESHKEEEGKVLMGRVSRPSGVRL